MLTGFLGGILNAYFLVHTAVKVIAVQPTEGHDVPGLRNVSQLGVSKLFDASLIDDILELSAIEAGMVQVEAEPVHLYALVNEVLTALASRTEARTVELKNEVAT